MTSDFRGGLVELVRPGESGLSGRSLWRFGVLVLTAVIVTVNLVGACAVLVVANFVVPLPPVAHPEQVRLVNAVVAVAYVPAAAALGAWLGVRGLFGLRRWLIEERPATPREQRIVLRAPLRLFALQVVLWWSAAVLFGTLNLSYSVTYGVRVAIIVAITGMVTAACAYLVTERLLRGPAARALAHGAPERLAVPGVATRAVLAWALGTGLPVLGVIGIGILSLTGDSATRQQLGVAMVALGGIAITVGDKFVGDGLLAVFGTPRRQADHADQALAAALEIERLRPQPAGGRASDRHRAELRRGGRRERRRRRPVRVQRDRRRRQRRRARRGGNPSDRRHDPAGRTHLGTAPRRRCSLGRTGRRDAQGQE